MSFKNVSISSPVLKKPSDYPHPAKGLVMSSGNVFVNYHGFCLFLTIQMKYLPWIVTKKNGQLPNTCEYGRLRKLCKEFVLSPQQELLVWEVVQKLEKNPLFGLTQKEFITAKAAIKARENEKARAQALVATKAKIPFKKNPPVAEIKKIAKPGKGQRLTSFEQLSQLIATS